MSEFLKALNEGFILFDGAMGTMLQSSGLAGLGSVPDLLSITHPEGVTAIHRAYVEAGSDVVTTNTFGANARKLDGTGHTAAEVIAAGVKCARASGARFVAADIGPTGLMLAPVGTACFDDVYDLFAEQAKSIEEAGADVVICETFSDLLELKAAILAVKENTLLPVIATMTFTDNGRTFLGTDPVTAATVLSGLGVCALGVNCSLGPEQLLPVVKTLVEYSPVPVIVQANAGLPVEQDGAARYDVTPEAYAKSAAKMLDLGVQILGGCCGTSPEYIRLLRGLMDSRKPVKPDYLPRTIVTSATRAHIMDGVTTVIGERLNPTGKKRMKEALRSGETDYLIGEAINQTRSGADVLDINVGLPELDEPKVMRDTVAAVAAVTDLPLQIDSSDPAAVETGVRYYAGAPIINSVNGKRETMDAIFPIAAKYGAVLVGLTLDENGIPDTAEGRFAIAERIVNEAAKYGIAKHRILIDCLVLTASAQQEQVLVTLEAIKLVRARLGVMTVLGVSNVSFGLPARPMFNSMFLSSALGAGLNAAIINPMAEDVMRAVDCFRVCSGEDAAAENYISRYADWQSAPQSTTKAADFAVKESGVTLFDCIIEGRDGDAAALTEALLETTAPIDIIESSFVPALDEVGRRYEAGKLFLPQLMRSADTTRKSFEVLRRWSDSHGEATASKGQIILATVRGDIHDIGKNIVKMLLQNYGYEVIDLGSDVPVELVVGTALEKNIRLVGLSALMTTTVVSMKETIAALRTAGADCRVMVGGAVLTEEYAKLVGADYYAKDAQASVRIAGEVFSD